MKRTLLAVGVAVLVSMMLVPMQVETIYPTTGLPWRYTMMRPFFYLTDCFHLPSALDAVRATNDFRYRSRRCNRQSVAA
jgi:hypothetical protein